jgi:hypothetical protein
MQSSKSKWHESYSAEDFRSCGVHLLVLNILGKHLSTLFIYLVDTVLAPRHGCIPKQSATVSVDSGLK